MGKNSLAGGAKIDTISSKRDEQFNEQDFTEGGIEFSHIIMFIWG